MHHLWQLKLLIGKNFFTRRCKLSSVVGVLFVPLCYTIIFCIMRMYNAHRINIQEESRSLAAIKNKFKPISDTIIGYAPRSPATDKFMNDVEQMLFQKSWFSDNISVQFLGFKSEYSMMNFEKDNPNFLSYAYAFDDVSFVTKTLPKHLHIILGLKRSNNEVEENLTYYNEALMLQVVMNTFINQCSGLQTNISINYNVISPTLKTRTDIYLVEDMFRIALIIIGLAAYQIWRSVYIISSERERCLSALLEQMGVNPHLYWLSWFLTLFIMNELMCLYFAGLMFAKTFNMDPIIQNSDKTTIIFYFSSLAFSLSSYCIFGSVLFKKAETCSAVASIIYILVTFPAIESVQEISKNAFPGAIFSSINIIGAFTHIGELEQQGIGYGWKRMAAHLKDEYFISNLLFSGILYIILAWISYNVVICRRIPRINTQALVVCSSQQKYQTTKRDGKTYSKIGIRVEKLCVNSSRKLTDITFIMLEDNVTVATGHELSGKSTFMSVLKGEILPAKGSVSIYGLDIRNDTLAVKLIMGLCPKEPSAIYLDMTVLENLQFFAMMKHLCQDQPISDIYSHARDFGLEPILKTPVEYLCLSDRRVLQVALAYLGENKVILLEDPTLNMDTRTKYRMWSIIRDKAYDKTVVVNTNIVDEAEMLGDRIAIFLDGELKCCGTMQYINMFLEVGYHLIVQKKDTSYDDHIEYLVNNVIPNSALTENTDRKMTFWLPMKEMGCFHSLLSLLYDHRQKLGIATFTVNAITLNDIIVDLSDNGYVPRKPIKVSAMDKNIVRSSSDTSLCNIKIKEQLNTILTDVKDSATVDGLWLFTRQPYRMAERRVSLDQLTQSFSTDSFLIHAILKSMGKARYTGVYMWYSQMCALIKKKVILSTCAIYIEAMQVVALLLLSFWPSTPLLENYCQLHECSQRPNFTTLLRTVVPYSQGPTRSNTSRAIAQLYRSLFLEPNVLILEYNESNVNMSRVAEFLTNAKLRAVVGASFNVSDNSDHLRANAYYLSKDIELGPSILRSLSAIMNTFLRYIIQSDRCSVYASTQNQIAETMILTQVVGKQAQHEAYRFSHHASVLNAISLVLVPYFVVTERNTGSKDLQLLSGTSHVLYWVSTFMWDYFTYMFMCNTYSLGSGKLNTDDAADLMLPLTSLYLVNGVMMIIYIYVVQSFFNSASTAAGFFMISNYCFGSPSSWTFVDFTRNEERMSVRDYFSVLYLAAPPHILPQAVYHLIIHKRATTFCDGFRSFCDTPNHISYREDCCTDICEKTGSCLEKTNWLLTSYQGSPPFQIMIIVIHTIIWVIFLILVELRTLRKCFQPSTPYQSKKRGNIHLVHDVNPMTARDGRHYSTSFKREDQSYGPRELILSSATESSSHANSNTCIAFQKVEKKRGDDIVVSEITLKIDDGDLFCFAGADIDSPSTVVNMICGLDVPTSGKITVNGKGFDTFGRPHVQHIGYCSHANTGILPTMTGQETLWMVARLRGVAMRNLKRLVEIYLSAFRLDSVANRHANSYSDCELRRLSIAAALIGEPEISLLCNPLHNLDSESKEAFWRWLKRLTNLKKTIVIASDNLHEIGNHAAYIMILVDGKPASMGTAESIEGLYCKGYTLLVKLDPKNRSGAAKLILKMLTDKMPKCQIFHGHQHLLHFHIPYEEDYLADIFAIIEAIKKKIKIESYRVNRANLDQVLTAAQNAYFVHGHSIGLFEDNENATSLTSGDKNSV